MKKLKHYAFLDVVIDVFYSIVLYNVFMAFKGFSLDSMLLFFAIFIMMDYWWSTRSFSEFPKYYLMDLYFITIIMFIFAQWPNYFNNIQNFLGILAVFLFVDTIYTISAIFYTKKNRVTKNYGSIFGQRRAWYYYMPSFI